ncbi:MAG: anion transporter, partial [Gammaproteobacteria bacterium]
MIKLRPAQIALLGGPLLAVVVFVALPAEFRDPDGVLVPLSPAARGTIAMTSWMALWWLTEALPVAATALLPVTLFPLLGLHDASAVAAAYAHPLIFLFLG